MDRAASPDINWGIKKMNWALDVGLPLSLVIIMLSLGLDLEIADFRRVLTRRTAFAIGAIAQIIIVPIIALVITLVFNFPPEIALGFFILSLCPGGVTSNVLAKLAKGDVALSVTLTAVVSLLSVLTVPIATAWAVQFYLGTAAPEISIGKLAIAIFIIITVPIILGIAVRRLSMNIATKVNRLLSPVSIVLFVVIVIAALATNWQIFIDNVGTMGAGLLLMCAILLALGFLFSRLAGLTQRYARTISIETGIQNATTGIFIGGLVMSVDTGLSPLAIPSAVYGILMYSLTFPLLLWLRRGIASDG